MGSPSTDPGAITPFLGYALAILTLPLLLAWRAGEGWARWVAWGIAVLLMPFSLLALFVAVLLFGFVSDPIAGIPLNIGMPIAGIIGSALMLWVVVPARAGEQSDRLGR